MYVPGCECLKFLVRTVALFENAKLDVASVPTKRSHAKVRRSSAVDAGENARALGACRCWGSYAPRVGCDGLLRSNLWFGAVAEATTCRDL